MLTPIRPQEGQPDYEKRLRDYTRAMKDKKQNPRNWGPAQQETPAKGRARPTGNK